MVAETYNDVATYMQAKNVTLVAKSSGYDVKKEAADGLHTQNVGLYLFDFNFQHNFIIITHFT